MITITKTFQSNDSWITTLDEQDLSFDQFKYVSGIGDTPEDSKEEFHIAYDLAKEVEAE